MRQRIYNRGVGAEGTGQIEKLQYSSLTSPVKGPIVARQQEIWQTSSAQAANAAAQYNFFVTAPTNPPIDGGGYRSPYIKMNMEIMGVGLDLDPKILVNRSAADIQQLNLFLEGASELYINEQKAATFNNSTIGPIYEYEESNQSSALFNVVITERPIPVFKEADTNVTDKMTVSDKMEVHFEVHFRAAFGFDTTEGTRMTAKILARPAIETFVG